MKHVYETDINGYFIRDVLLREGEEMKSNYVETPLPHGMFSPKFVNGEWVNGITETEISEMMGSDIATLKKKKDEELNTACQESILSGFTHIINGVTYWFSYDYEAQGNFRDAKEILSDGVVPEVPWTVRMGGKDGDYTRIPINLETMKELTVIIMEHKLNNIGKYRDFLLPILYDEATDTPEKIEAVKWS